MTEREVILIARVLQAVADYRDPLTYQVTAPAIARPGFAQKDRLQMIAAVKGRRESALDRAIADLREECHL